MRNADSTLRYCKKQKIKNFEVQMYNIRFQVLLIYKEGTNVKNSIIFTID